MDFFGLQGQPVKCTELEWFNAFHLTRFCRDYLLITPLGQLRRNRRQIAKQASGLPVGASGEVDLGER